MNFKSQEFETQEPRISWSPRLALAFSLAVSILSLMSPLLPIESHVYFLPAYIVVPQFFCAAQLLIYHFSPNWRQLVGSSLCQFLAVGMGFWWLWTKGLASSQVITEVNPVRVFCVFALPIAFAFDLLRVARLVRSRAAFG